VHLALLACILATGCDYALRLDEVPAPDGDAQAPCVEIGHDEDSDGLDDACDPCPFDANNAGDADSDGIADTCDPDPTTPNKVLLFEGFGARAPALTAAGGSIMNDAWVPSMANSNGLYWLGQADPIWIIAGVDVSGLMTAPYREVGVAFDATVGGQEPDGTYCVLGSSSSDYVQVYVRARPAGDLTLSNLDANLPLAELRGGIVRGRHSRALGPGSSCSFTSQLGGQTGIAGLRTPPPAQAAIALYASHVEAAFAFVFLVGPA
jgi:hypothetical protein